VLERSLIVEVRVLRSLDYGKQLPSLGVLPDQRNKREMGQFEEFERACPLTSFPIVGFIESNNREENP
jgi:hypothetical protein